MEAYDAVSLEQFRSNLYFTDIMQLRPLPRSYKSTWRVLHVDGFEGGRKIQFYGYTPMGAATV